MKNIVLGFILVFIIVLGFNIKADDGDWLQEHEPQYKIEVVTVCDVPQVIFAVSYVQGEVTMVWDFAGALLREESPYTEIISEIWKEAAKRKQVFIYETDGEFMKHVTGGLGCAKGTGI